MNTRRRSVLALALLVLTASLAQAQARRPMTLVDVLNVPHLGSPQLSPDGRQILFVKEEADWKANQRISHIWRINADGTGLVQMTNGEKGESGPRWSPDGSTIAFVAKRGDSEEGQIHLLGNAGGEARRLSKHETSVSALTWSPDGSSIYFLAADPKSSEEKDRDKARDDVFAFDENYKQQHLWKIGVTDAAERRVTIGDYSVLSYNLSRDGKRIACHRGPDPLYGSADQSEVWVMDADGGNATQLTRNTVPENGAELSPDNSQVLFLAQANLRFETYYNRKIFVIPASGGNVRVLTADLPHEVEWATWSKDGGSILFVANMGVHSEIFRLDASGGKPAQLTSGEHAIVSGGYNPGLDRMVFIIDEPANPGEVWELPAAGGAPLRVTHVFDDIARNFLLPKQERIEWKGADGVTVEGLLFYPIDYQPGRRYALAVQTHGGPQASDKFGFGYWLNYVQALTAKGYAVLQPNYRGSTGYGDTFLRDMVGHYFQNAHLDVMAGVDHVIKMGVADPERMVKMGWSGGGHMTNKIITFTDRFKAASSGAGASNWISMYAQSDVRSYRTPWFGGSPWQKNMPFAAYWDNSPLKYVANVKTPTIFLVGQQDVRVPPPQSVEMYRALKSNGVPTHLYMAPREPHVWGELHHDLFKMNVELDWFEKYAMGRSYTWEKAPSEGKEAAKEPR